MSNLTLTLTDQELSYLLDDLNVSDYKTVEQQKELLRLQEKLAEAKAGVIKKVGEGHMCPAYYEINISLNGKHYFATAERSITMFGDLREKYRELKKRFPKEEGYHIMITAKYQYGKILKEDQI